MPELPEVESVRRSLLPHIVGRRIVRAELLRRDILVAPGDPFGGFSRQRGRRRGIAPIDITSDDLLQGSTITDIRRRGKQLAIIARNDGGQDRALGVQLGMTGHMAVGVHALGGLGDTHIHARWTLEDDTTFVFEDARRFGTLRVFRSLAELEEHWHGLGPDALTVRPVQLALALLNTRRAIKAALLDQSVIAGVGNIYADEALFRSRIHPRSLASKLTRAQTDALTRAIRAILREAVRAGGSTLSNYADASGTPGSYQARHAVYGRGGKPCPRCGRRLASALVAQRTTVWCPHCQPAPKSPRRSRRPPSHAQANTHLSTHCPDARFQPDRSL